MRLRTLDDWSGRHRKREPSLRRPADRTVVRLRVCLLLVVAALACSDNTAGPDSDSSPVAYTERRVDPPSTGAGISGATGQHFVVASEGGSGADLLVFLPGTGGRPEFYTTFLRYAGTQGHHAIGLAYPNVDAVNDLCAAAPSPTCHEDVRVEVITGQARSPLVGVDATNSIDNRLRAILVWLAANFPAEGWGGFLSNGEPRWERITVAGHSQGGGHAAMIARLRRVGRAVLFSSTEPAPWTTSSFATPKSQLYGFVHRQEQSYAGITTSWRFMELAGSVTSVDGASPPFGGSHQLQTNETSCGQVAVLDTFHNCVITNVITPLRPDGQPLFGAVWTYLLEG